MLVVPTSVRAAVALAPSLRATVTPAGASVVKPEATCSVVS
jgi:hypothetical protein